ncbi:MAG: cobalt transporter CbiM [Nitrospiraceae bacterium]|nr:MAG: cobalt transporter CbiM [Nitrospiraceae bacterium]
MHIPDGYLSPQTYLPFYGIMLPLWYLGSRILRKALNAKQIPLLALSAAFSFIIMMFNIPVPGGSSGHATGSVLIAIILGPWAALMAVSMALIIQALLFGDGGITAIGANCFNVAFVMSFSGYYIYRLLSFNSGTNIPRRIFAACVAAYVSINLAAFFTAVEFGIQPYIAHKADGTPLYGPYSLDVAVPIMAFEHLAVFGFIEALVTGLVVAYIARSDPSMLNIPALSKSAYQRSVSSARRRLWIGLGILILLTPLGLIASGTAWGEWGLEEIMQMLGFEPEGMKNMSNLWQSALPGYALPGLNGPIASVVGYLFSAVVGTGVVLLTAFIISRFVFRGR